MIKKLILKMPFNWLIKIIKTNCYWKINDNSLMKLVLISVILLNFNGFQQINAFNLSPKPNIILKEPDFIPTTHPKIRSSYFGFTINLRTKSIIIGAPQAQSSLPSQHKNNETGAIYRCSLENHMAKTGTCLPYIIDDLGDVIAKANQFSYENEYKDFQWLGASMDGSNKESDRFVVCAPRLRSDDKRNNYLLNGICYLISNTIGSKPLEITKISPLKIKDKQYGKENGESIYNYMFGEQGISVHITENNEEVLIGCPGVKMWRGSIIRNRLKEQTNDLGGLSKRSISINNNYNIDQFHGISKRSVIESISDVPNPKLWNQQDGSYFGYAITSGYFVGRKTNKTLYAASAPQANDQHGEVYIFDIIDDFSSDTNINIFHTFQSTQMGEYFGYSLIGEDFDNDGFTDLAIGAPFHSHNSETYDNGVVYIYRNIEGTSFNLHATLASELDKSSGRFGISLSKIGDINMDGYNDLAVGVPYENDGAVYIYLGSPNGLISKPSQIISSPNYQPSSLTVTPLPGLPSMFGHGLSKGADIDGNYYLDFAIGAPDAERVYIYKAYPVVKIIASITAENNEIQIGQKTMNLKACCQLQSKYPTSNNASINLIIKLDPQHGRVTFPNGQHILEMNKTIGEFADCMDLEALVKFSTADVFKPIDLDINYSLLNGIPIDSEEFCEHCMAINPMDSKMVRSRIVFSTGCKTNKCVADLKVFSTIREPTPYILGSTKSLAIDYKIENLGEIAYLTNINITIPDSVTFMKTPATCQPAENNPYQMLCAINNGQPLISGAISYFKIYLDTTKLTGSELVVRAHVSSTGDEKNEMDNYHEDRIQLTEFSDIEISGKSTKPFIALEDGIRTENISHTFEFRNNGPSFIRNAKIIISIPLIFLNELSLEQKEIIDFSSISINCIHKNNKLITQWTQNNTIILHGTENLAGNSPTVSPLTIQSIDISSNDNSHNLNGLNFDPTNIGLHYDINSESSMGISNQESIDQLQHMHRRRRRQLIDEEMPIIKNYNRYTKTVHDVQMTSLLRKQETIKHDSLLNHLPINRTILMDCYDGSDDLCIHATAFVKNFEVGNDPIIVTLNFSVDLSKIDKIVTEKQDILVLRSTGNIFKLNDENKGAIKVTQSNPFTIISKYHVQATPFWVWILAVIGGLLLLVLITYILYKLGFFKREKKEELEQIKRQSVALALHQGTDNLDD